MIQSRVVLVVGAVVVACCAVLAAQESPPAAQPETSVEQKPSPAAIAARAALLLDRLENPEPGERPRAVFEEIGRLLKELQSLEPTHAQLTFLTARYYAAAGRSGDAIELLREYTGTVEGRAEWRAFRLLGDLFAVDYPRLAKASYDQAAALNPNEPSVLYGLSVCAVKFGDADEAIRLAQLAAGSGDDRPLRYYSHLASLLSNAARWPEAVREAERALGIARKRAAAAPADATALAAVDAQYQVLITVLQNRITQSGHSGTDEDLKLARAVRERARLGEKLAAHQALRIIEAALERTGAGAPTALKMERATLLADVGRTAEAVAVLEDLLKSEPGNTAAAEELAKLRSSNQ